MERREKGRNKEIRENAKSQINFSRGEKKEKSSIKIEKSIIKKKLQIIIANIRKSPKDFEFFL